MAYSLHEHKRVEPGYDGLVVHRLVVHRVHSKHCLPLPRLKGVKTSLNKNATSQLWLPLPAATWL